MTNYKKDSFLGSGYEKLDLKYIFDHLRNLGIAVAILVAAAKSNPESIVKLFPNLTYYPSIVPLTLAVISLLLIIMNFSQFLYVAVNNGTRVAISIWAVLSIPLYALTVFICTGYLLVD